MLNNNNINVYKNVPNNCNNNNNNKTTTTTNKHTFNNNNNCDYKKQIIKNVHTDNDDDGIDENKKINTDERNYLNKFNKNNLIPIRITKTIIVEEFKSVQTLKEFWDNRIKSSSIDNNNKKLSLIKIKSSTLNSNCSSSIINNYSDINIKYKSATLDRFNYNNNNNNRSFITQRTTTTTTNHNNNNNNNQLEENYCTVSSPLYSNINYNNLKLSSTELIQRENQLINDNKNLINKYEKINEIKRNSNNNITSRLTSNNLITTDLTNDFYKFKTADTVKKKRKTLQIQSIDYNLALAKKRHSIDSLVQQHDENIIKLQQQQQQQHQQQQLLPTDRQSLQFPIISMNLSGDKIHWAKRDEIFANFKNLKEIDSLEIDKNKDKVPVEREKNNDKDKLEKEKNKDTDKLEREKLKDKVLSLSNNINKDKDRIIEIEREKDCENDIVNNGDNLFIDEKEKMVVREHETYNLITTIQKEMEINDKIVQKEMEINDKIVLSTTKAEKSEIINNMLSDENNSVQTDIPRKTLVSTSVRKLSFKTHPRNGGYHHRKMVVNSGSKVAALTLRFNQLISEDAGILEEVKKKGVLYKTPSCVYKIREEGVDSGSIRRKNIKKSDDCVDDGNSGKLTTGKRKTNIKRKESEKVRPLSCVKAAIEIFEPKTEVKVSRSNIKIVKPKVPDKSEEVLLKTKEIALRRKLNAINSIIKESEGLEILCKSNPNITIIEIPKNETAVLVEEPKLELVAIVEEPEVRLETSDKIEKIEVIGNSPVENIVQNEIKIIDKEIKIETSHVEPTSIEEVLTFAVDEIPQVKEKSKNIFKKWKVMESGEKIYERMRLKFTHKKAPSEKQIQKSLTKRQHEIEHQESCTSNPDQKIVEALCDVSQKIEHLSKSENNLSIQENSSREFILPNDSFLYRSSSKTSFGSTSEIQHTSSIVEAINTAVISKTQSMDETRFPTSSSFLRDMLHRDDDDISTIFKQTKELTTKILNDYEDYEFITWPKKTEICTEEEIDEGEEVFEEYAVSEQEDPVFIENIYETPKRKPKINQDNDDIYQSISEVKASMMEDHHSDSGNSYESYNNYELVSLSKRKIKPENGYEVCDRPLLPPPRKCEPIPSQKLQNNIVPALPVPKRNNFYETQNGEELPSYEKIKYDKTPPRPPKSSKFGSELSQSLLEIQEIPIEKNEKEHDYEDDIYESIRHRKQHPIKKPQDTLSINSNCYESISSIGRQDYIQLNQNLKHSDSMSTLSSEHKTNSLYGTTVGQSITPPSEGSSEGSDDWVDISDSEDAGMKRYIVYRQRPPPKCRRKRDLRINQPEDDDDINEDDSDNHHYESLYSAKYPVKQQTIGKREIPEIKVPTIINTTNINKSKIIYDDLHNHHQHHHHREHQDEIASDTFSEGETDEDVKKNDSGVDISHTKLPDLPPSPIYSILKTKFNKIKSFKKSFSKITKKAQSKNSDVKQTKPETYEDTKLYVKHEYQNTDFVDKVKTSKIPPNRPLKKISLKPIDPYENTEFHSPRTPTSVVPIIFPNVSSPKPSHNDVDIYESNLDINGDINNLNRKKTKSIKSSKKVLRNTESNLSIDTRQLTQSTFYISDSCEPDSGIFSGSNDKIQITDEKETTVATPILPQTEIKTVTVETYSTPKITAPPRRKNKFFHSPELNRRKTTIGIRPLNPPPPPPVNPKQKNSGSTWYTECGVFKSDTLNEDSSVIKDGRKQRNSTASWYADAGVYQTSAISVASSSGSSGVSSSGGPGDDNSHSMFFNEPLYQIYSAAKLESISRDIEMGSEQENGYEEVGRNRPPEEEKKNLRPSALQLVGPRQASRTLWSEIPEVINSGILGTLTMKERRLQEAKFEILTSEASYLKSLNLLKSHFIQHPAFRDPKNLSPENRKCLFSCITPVLDCSDRLLCDLESCWQDNIMLLGLSHSIYKHAEKSFHVYISFCEHQGKLDRLLKKLKEEKNSFREALELLELSENCHGLSFHSFLMLPMQRITRLPLLIDAVLTKLDPNDDEFANWERTFLYLNKIVKQCNEAANRCEQAYEIKAISQSIEFPHNIIPIPIIPVGPGALPRTLIRRGELTHLTYRNDDGKLTFGKRFTKSSIYAFLFTDLLVLTKKKSEETFVVTDYCQRSMLTVSSGDVIPQLPTKDIPLAGKNLILMTLLENHEKKTVELIFSCGSATDRQRWLQATEPPSSENPGEKLYEGWDCPQVHALHPYHGTQPDELTLEIGDVIKVYSKMVDGWYHGERIRDGVQGWFPGNYTKEIQSPHVCARNLKQRHCLLLLSASYLEAQKKV